MINTIKGETGRPVQGEYIMNGIKQKSRRYRQKRRIRSHKRSMVMISLVIILMGAAASVSSMTLLAKEKTYQAQEIELKEQIQEEKDRAAEIEELEKYVGTDEYVEEVAREKLGLVYKDEIIFKAK